MTANSANKKPQPPNRHQGRELALQLLYAFELVREAELRKAHKKNETPKCDPDILKEVLIHYKKNQNEYEVPLNDFTKTLLETVINNLAQVDQHLINVIKNWDLGRLSHIDRNLLRLAVAEIYYFQDIPPKVTINEYIEIAKVFGDNDSPSFVNGILDAIARNSDKGKDIKSLNDQDAQH